MIKIKSLCIVLLPVFLMTGCLSSKENIKPPIFQKKDLKIEKSRAYIENYEISVSEGRSIWFPETLTEEGFLYSERTLKVPPKSVTWKKTDSSLDEDELERFFKMKEAENKK